MPVDESGTEVGSVAHAISRGAGNPRPPIKPHCLRDYNWTVEDTIDDKRARDKIITKPRVANSADVRKRRTQMVDLWRSTQPLKMTAESRGLAGDRVALPQLGVRLVIDSDVAQFDPPDARGSRRAASARVRSTTSLQPPVSKPAQTVAAIDRLPQAEIGANAYLQSLRDRAAAAASQKEAATEQDHALFQEFARVVGETCSEDGHLPSDETLVQQAFWDYVTHRDASRVKGIVRPTPLAESQEGLSGADVQHAPHDSAGGEAMDHVPAPSGIEDTWSHKPKLRMHSADKRNHLARLVERQHAPQQHREPLGGVSTHQPVKRSKADMALSAFHQFHKESREVASIRATQRQVQSNNKLYRRHNKMLERPMLTRRTVGDDMFAPATK